MTALRSKTLARALWSLMEDDKQSSNDVARQFFRFVEINHISHMVPGVVRHLERMSATKRAESTLDIRTAHPISKGLIDAIRARMNVPEDALIDVEEDTALVGGFVGKYGKTIYDASMQKQLLLLRNKLLN